MEKGVNISYTPRGIMPRDPDVADEDFPHAYFEEGHVQHHPEPAPVAVGTDPPRPTEGSVVFQEGHHLSARYSTNSGQRESSSALFSDSGFHWPSVEKPLLCYLGQLEEIKMYGMVNQAVRGLVLEQFGKELPRTSMPSNNTTIQLLTGLWVPRQKSWNFPPKKSFTRSENTGY